VLVWLLNTLLALPSVVVGLLVYLLLSRAGPLGAWGILFTPTAMVIAQSILVVPLIAALARRLVLNGLRDGGDQLRSMGAGPMTSALLLLVHERIGVLTIALTAFGRAIAEVGAVMIVGGNIEGVTRVMTTAIALETSKGDLPLALALGLVLLGVVGLAQCPDRPGAARLVRRARGLRMSGGAPLLSLHAAGVCFGEVRALRDVTLTLHRGERLMLLGTNGSGKTTLLRALHGLIDCSEGRREVHPLGPERRAPVAAMLFQHPFLLNLSARANLRLGLWLRGVPKAERARRCDEALQRVGLSHVAGRSARALSGGQQQRLALARAWALRPDILFLDEPTASLDPSAKREVEALVAEFAQDGVTVVMSTHTSARPSAWVRGWPTWRTADWWSTCRWSASSVSGFPVRPTDFSRASCRSPEGSKSGRMGQIAQVRRPGAALDLGSQAAQQPGQRQQFQRHEHRPDQQALGHLADGGLPAFVVVADELDRVAGDEEAEAPGQPARGRCRRHPVGQRHQQADHQSDGDAGTQMATGEVPAGGQHEQRPGRCPRPAQPLDARHRQQHPDAEDDHRHAHEVGLDVALVAVVLGIPGEQVDGGSEEAGHGGTPSSDQCTAGS
jgi:tungstate transport system ATP-binding protein